MAQRKLYHTTRRREVAVRSLRVVARLLESFFDTALVLGAVTTVDPSPNLTRWLLHFQLLPLAPLTPEASRELLWAHANRGAFPDGNAFERHGDADDYRKGNSSEGKQKERGAITRVVGPALSRWR
jgi:hypothetical protein